MAITNAPLELRDHTHMYELLLNIVSKLTIKETSNKFLIKRN